MGSSKMTRSAMLAILFFILASPEAFALVQALLGDVVRIANGNGVPTLAGLLVHALVFGALVLAMMKMKYRKKWRKGKWGKGKGKWKKGKWAQNKYGGGKGGWSGGYY